MVMQIKIVVVVVGPLTSLANHVTLKIKETTPTIYSPYPRKS